MPVERASLGFPVLLTRFFAPRSATGEDTAEVMLPGNPALVDRVIDRLIDAAPDRLRRAEPGEFTARAFLNGRLDLVQAEGVARLIAARSEAEREAAQRLVSGAEGARYAEWNERLATLLALTEAGIDFSDQEDVVAISPRDLAAGLAALQSELLGVLGADVAIETREIRPRVVLVGPPNAGKSTLFNALLGRRRAVVSEAAGSTRDVLVEPLDLSADVPGGPEVELCDLAGVVGGVTGGGSRDEPAPSARRPGVLPSLAPELAQRAARMAIAEAGVLIVCEPRGRFDEVERLLPPGTGRKPTLRVRTKADLPASACGGATGADALAVCALDGWQLPALRRAMADAAMEAAHAAGDALPRHRASIARAADAIGSSLVRIDPARRSLPDPEVVAVGLRVALDCLGEITGRTTTDDILGRVFASFCVGK